MRKKFTPIILVLLLISFSTVSASGDWWWEDSFVKARHNVYSSGQFLVIAGPYLGSKIIKVTHGKMIPAVGYVDNDGTRFYMSKWSYKQFKKGKRPNWFVPQ